jgi:site-specific DNA-methyltransferase (adenine-specific)
LQRVCANCGAKQRFGGCDCPNPTFVNPTRQNFHPTVKPTDLMRYLCRLVTPPGGICSLILSWVVGQRVRQRFWKVFDLLGLQMEEEYIEIAKARHCSCG